MYDMRKIFIDNSSLLYNKKTGVEIYLDNVIRILNSSCNELLLIYPSVFRLRWDNYLFKIFYRLLIEQLIIPINLIIKKPNYAIFCVSPPGILCYISKIFGVSIINVIHDDVPWKLSSTQSFFARIYLNPLYKLSARLSSKLVTVSETSRMELAHLINRNLNNCSIDIESRVNFLNSLNNNKYSFAGEYILSVATIEPRKNIYYLIDVVSKYNDMQKANFALILAGRIAWENSDKLTKYAKLKNVYLHFAGFIDDSILVSLYKRCHFFALLSRSEGFGLPPLEAAALGSKVVVSDIPIFRENLSDYALFVPLDDCSAAAQYISENIYKPSRNFQVTYTTDVFKENWLNLIK